MRKGKAILKTFTDRRTQARYEKAIENVVNDRATTDNYEILIQQCNTIINNHLTSFVDQLKSRLQRGESYSRIKNYSKAIRDLSFLIENLDRNHNLKSKLQLEYYKACLDLAEIYSEQKNIKEAQKFLLKTDENQRDHSYYEEMGNIYYIEEDFNNALKYYYNIIVKQDEKEMYKEVGYQNKNKFLSKIFFSIAQSYSMLGNSKVAKDNYIKAMKYDSENFLAKYRIITYDIIEKRFKEAEEALNSVSTSQQDINYYEALIYLSLARKDFIEALRNLQKCKELKLISPNDEYFLMSSFINLYKKDYKEFYSDFIKINPESKNHKFNKFHYKLQAAIYYYIQGDYEIAKKYFKEARKETYVDSYLYLIQASYITESKEYQESINFLNSAIERFSGNELLYELRGENYLKLKNYELAKKDFDKSLELKPLKQESKAHLGRYWYKIQNYEEALKSYFESIEGYSKEDPYQLTFISNSYNNISKIYYAQGNYAQAISYLNDAITLVDDNSKFYSNLGLIYNEIGEYELALENFKKALSIKPAHAAKLEPYIQTIEEQQNIEKEYQTIKNSIEQIIKDKKLKFKSIKPQTFMKKLQIEANAQTELEGNSSNNPNMHKLAWRDLDKSKSKIYGVIDETSHEIKKLDPGLLKAFKETLKDGVIVSNWRGKAGTKLVNKVPELKIYGAQGVGNHRLWAEIVKNENNEQIYLFKHEGKHKSKSR